MTPELITAFGQFGPLGLLVGYLVWERRTDREQRRELEQAQVAAEAARAESDKALAGALAALTVTIQHLDGRLK
jgi:hypothetical protein